MGWWKSFCTCAGCALGIACVIATGGAATPLVAAVAIGGGGVAANFVGHKIEQEEKKKTATATATATNSIPIASNIGMFDLTGSMESQWTEVKEKKIRIQF